jgi:hypothetical protein
LLHFTLFLLIIHQHFKEKPLQKKNSLFTQTWKERERKEGGVEFPSMGNRMKMGRHRQMDEGRKNRHLWRKASKRQTSLPSPAKV